MSNSLTHADLNYTEWVNPHLGYIIRFRKMLFSPFRELTLGGKASWALSRCSLSSTSQVYFSLFISCGKSHRERKIRLDTLASFPWTFALIVRFKSDCFFQFNSLTTIGYLLEVFIRLWIPSMHGLYIHFCLEIVLETWLKALLTFSVGSWPCAHPLISERSIVRALQPENAPPD